MSAGKHSVTTCPCAPLTVYVCMTMTSQRFKRSIRNPGIIDCVEPHGMIPSRAQVYEYLLVLRAGRTNRFRVISTYILTSALSYFYSSLVTRRPFANSSRQSLAAGRARSLIPVHIRHTIRFGTADGRSISDTSSMAHNSPSLSPIPSSTNVRCWNFGIEWHRTRSSVRQTSCDKLNVILLSKC